MTLCTKVLIVYILNPFLYNNECYYLETFILEAFLEFQEAIARASAMTDLVFL